MYQLQKLYVEIARTSHSRKINLWHFWRSVRLQQHNKIDKYRPIYNENSWINKRKMPILQFDVTGAAERRPELGHALNCRIGVGRRQVEQNPGLVEFMTVEALRAREVDERYPVVVIAHSIRVVLQRIEHGRLLLEINSL